MIISKSKSKKILIIIMLVLSICIPVFLYFGMYSNDYDFEISEYVADITVDEYGDMHVKEKITNKYSNTNTVFYKNLIYGKNNSFSHNNDNSYLVENVRVKVEENNNVVFDTDVDKGSYSNFVGYSYNNDRDERGDYIRCNDTSIDCEMIFYYDASGIGDVTTFTYEYTIKGVVTQYKDISEFNWVLLGVQPMNVKNVKITLNLPEGDYDVSDSKTFFHGATNAKREFVSDNKIVITTKKLYKGEEIETRLLLDNDVFDHVRENNKSSLERYDDILAFEEAQTNMSNLEYDMFVYGSIGLFVFAIVLLGLFFVNAYRKYDKEFVSDFYNEYYRELPASYPPAVMGYLYKFKEIDDNDLTATLLDLIRKKYLIIDNPLVNVTDNDQNYRIVLNKEKSDSDLTELEKYLIKWFIKDIGDGDSVTSKQLSTYCDDISGAQDYQASNKKWVDLVELEAKKYDFFDKSINSAKKRYSIFSVFIFFISILLFAFNAMVGYTISLLLGVNLIFLTIAYLIYVNSFNRRSKSGNEDFVRWKAFKNFLQDFSTFEDYPVPSLIIWEHYLVYATSFGIADKVMKQLKLKFDVSQINERETTFVVYYGLRYNHIVRLNSNVRSAKMNAISTIAKHNSSRSGLGGGRSGGGFSGGSSFGGGGGSFGGR